MTIPSTPAPVNVDQLREALDDPNAVHVNLLRGSIARPSVRQIVHIYGEAALRAVLPSPEAEALAAAQGYLLNIKIDLQTGVSKAKVIDNVERLRAALASMKGPEA